MIRKFYGSDSDGTGYSPEVREEMKSSPKRSDTPSEAEDAGEYKRHQELVQKAITSPGELTFEERNEILTYKMPSSAVADRISEIHQKHSTPLPVQTLNERAEAYASKGKPEGLSHTSALANAIVESLKEAYIAGATESLSVPVDVVEKLKELNPYSHGRNYLAEENDGWVECCDTLEKLLTQNNKQKTT